MINNLFPIISNIIISLFIFLFGLKLLSSSLEDAFFNLTSSVLRKFTNNYFNCFLLGVILTAITGSSTAVTALALSFITSKQISKNSGLIIVIASNIGTSFSTILFGFNFYMLIPLFFIFGFLFSLVKIKKLNLISKILYGLGFLFFGLNMISLNTKNLFTDNLIIFSFNLSSINYIYMFFSGIILSFLIQSSNAGIGLVQRLCLNNIISLKAAISFMLGANIGTTISGIIISIVCTTDARRVSFINFLFNLVGSIIFLIFIEIYTSLFLSFKNAFNLNSAHLVSLSHIIYNFVTTALFMIILLIKEKKKKI